MEIVSMRKNCLGTMDFTLKIGKMRKAESFCTYPVQRDDDGAILRLQSSHRWAELNTKTGAVEMSERKANFANNLTLLISKMNGRAEMDAATPEQLGIILAAVRGTASPMAGGNNILGMYCDNSNAGLL